MGVISQRITERDAVEWGGKLLSDSARPRIDWGSSLFAGCISATSYAFLLSGEEFASLVAAQAIVISLPLIALCLFDNHRRFLRKNLILWSSISVALLATILLNVESYPTDTHTLDYVVVRGAGVVGVLFAVQWAAANLRPINVFKYTACILWPLAMTGVIIAIQQEGLVVRHSPFGAHPNQWGSLGFALVVTTLAIGSRAIRCLFIGTGLFLFVLVESRGALVAALVSLVAYALLSMRTLEIDLKSSVLMLSGLLMAVVFLPTEQLAATAVQFINQDVLLLYDPDRGLGTGLTGRVSGWLEALDTFSSNPIAGNGLDTLASVHNGFLRLLGEGGLILSLLLLTATVLRLREALKERNHVLLSLLGGYTAFLMTYPTMMNLNIVSTLAYFCLFSWFPNRHRTGLHRKDNDHSQLGLWSQNLLASGRR